MTTVTFLCGLIRVTQYAFFEQQKMCPGCGNEFVAVSGTYYCTRQQIMFRKANRDTHFCSDLCKRLYREYQDYASKEIESYSNKWG